MSENSHPSLTSTEVREAFFEFFREKGHEVVPSASLVPQDDPTLLFINAGMNQFKDVFLGTGARPYHRAVDTQKCLRVSGKHNDLEEVGVDTYHHTFFEMLGNWSFGGYEDSYFKKEAIRWAWELLVDRWGLEGDRLYATVHEGDEALGLDADDEAAGFWASETGIAEDHILFASSKDNFWMMGETGPCGPCSEVHIDLRPEEERRETPGKQLVNQDDPRVIEIWNLVFIQYNAKPDGTLEPLTHKHVDTGMGFERMCAVLQGSSSTYDTDLFRPLLDAAAEMAPNGESYDAADEGTAIALRVVADHIRTLTFAIADGAQPGNTGRGYVIRRILRRAVRYGYQVLGFREPFLYRLVGTVVEKMGETFPEIVERRSFLERVVQAEEESFLRTLSSGIESFERIAGYVDDLSGRRDTRPDEEETLSEDTKTLDLLSKAYADVSQEDFLADVRQKAAQDIISGEVIFLLHDTYGFPSDLTALMARERDLKVDKERFEELMQEQRARARRAADFSSNQDAAGDWGIVRETTRPSEFVGYDTLGVGGLRVLRQRTVHSGDDEMRHELVLDRTPFYAEAGGQVGDTGTIQSGDERLNVFDTVKGDEGEIVHIVSTLPSDPKRTVYGTVDADRRKRIMRHHSATHLVHEALREILGDHVQQKGSLVAPDRLRFDFSHFEAVSDDEQRSIEHRVNEVVLRNISLKEERAVPIEETRARGARMLFGEKYGDKVRVISFVDDDFSSVELCGGTHVRATGEVGMFRVVSEGSVAGGIRRIEAVAGEAALAAADADRKVVASVSSQFKTPGDPAVLVSDLVDHTNDLEREVEELRQAQAASDLDQWIARATDVEDVRLVTEEVPGADMDLLRSLAEKAADRLKATGSKGIAVFGAADLEEGKAYLAASVTEDVVSCGVHAGNLVGALAKELGGGGGGRPHLATAGGRLPEKLTEALGRVPGEVNKLLGSTA